jgi:hypothetical protein
MKTIIKNIFATTGMTLLVLSLIAIAYGGKLLCIRTVFESLFVNILINVGLIFVNRIESKYYFIEILYEIAYVLLIILPSGFLFGWYAAIPLWIIALMSVAIYSVSCFINIFRVTSDVEDINRQIKSMKQKTE